MQNKLRQLITSALKRNMYTVDLDLTIQVRGYYVSLHGDVPSQQLHDEVLQTVELVSPHLRVQSHLVVKSTVLNEITLPEAQAKHAEGVPALVH